MSNHHLHIQASNSKAAQKLKAIYSQWDAFLKTMSAFSEEQEAEFLKSFILDNKLIETFDKRLPYFHTPCKDIAALYLIDDAALYVFEWLLKRLSELHIIRKFWYTTTNEVIILWVEDHKKLSKNLKSKIKRIW